MTRHSIQSEEPTKRPTAQKAKHRRIHDSLRSAIEAGEYAVGGQIPTEAELGRRFGVSRLTVSRALRDLEGAGYLDRRRGVGSFVRPWREAKRGTLWGLLVPRPARGVFASICEEIVHESETAGFGVLLAGSMSLGKDIQLTRVEQFCEQVIARRLAGVYFGPMELPAPQMHLNSEIAEKLDKAGIPVVLLDRDLCDYPRRSGFDLVAVDNRGSVRVLTEHLLGLGYRRIEFVLHDYTVSSSSARVAGYREGMLAHGISPDPRWVHRWDVEDRSFVRHLVRESLAEAYVCVNDRLAESFMHNLAVLGVHVPEDVAIVGFDDIDRSLHLPVGLTTMAQPARYVGKVAVRMMLERLQDPGLPARETLLTCKLIVRESCGAGGSREIPSKTA